MEKPKNIDQDAKWKFDAWHKGTLLENGKPQGAYTIWEAGGRLTDQGLFDEQGNIIWFKSYYPDGSIGRAIEYKEDTNLTRVRYRSYHKNYSKILTPLAIGDKGYAEKVYEGKISVDCKAIFNGAVEGVSFYNEQGVFISTYESKNYTILIEKYTQKEEAESWKMALDRLSNFELALKKQYLKDEIEMEHDYYTISFDKSVHKEDLKKAEKRLGIHFPPSYNEFVLNYGLIKFGEKEGRFQDIEQRMLHPNEIQNIGNLLDPEGEGLFDEYFTLTKEERKKVICFFKDQVDFQYEGWIAFDYTSTSNKEKKAIMEIGFKNIARWENNLGKQPNQEFNSMDKFISAYVDRLIIEREP